MLLNKETKPIQTLHDESLLNVTSISWDSWNMDDQNKKNDFNHND